MAVPTLPIIGTPGSAGGLEAQVTTNDQKKWDGMGSPPEAVGKSGTPYHQHC